MKRTIVPLTLFCTLACTDETTGDEQADEAATSDESDTSDETDTGPVPESLAHDIDISLVEINQGVATPIAVAGEWVGPADRNAQIVGGRDSLLRAHWTLAPGFEPREIRARLTLQSPDSEPWVRDQILDVSAESFAGDLSRTFTFDIVADKMIPGTTFSVSLWEVDPSFAILPPPELEPISPRDGSSAAIGIQPELLTMKVVLVPIESAWPGCSASVPMDTVLEDFEDFLLMKNPAQAVELSVREQPVVIDQTPVDFWGVLPAIQDARIADNAQANVYYYGVIDACAYDLGGFGGMSWAIVSDEKTADFQRVSAGLYLANDPQFNADTFVHELGHLQGLSHVECPGVDSAAPDPTYPYENGVIGIWGFGIRDFKLRNPTAAHDYMSYCYSGNWTSDWTWAKNFDRIRTLTSWDAGGAVPSEPEGTLLIGVLGDAGGEQWWTIPGRIPERDLDRDRLRVRTLASAATLEPNATQHRAPEGGATIVTIELPMALTIEQIDRVEVLDGAGTSWQPRDRARR